MCVVCVCVPVLVAGCDSFVCDMYSCSGGGCSGVCVVVVLTYNGVGVSSWLRRLVMLW